MSAPDRRLTLDRDHPTLSLRRQCALLGVARSGVYRRRCPANDDDLALMRLMGIVPLGAKPRTSKPGAGHKIYPHLLRGLVTQNRYSGHLDCHLPTDPIPSGDTTSVGLAAVPWLSSVASHRIHKRAVTAAKGEGRPPSLLAVTFVMSCSEGRIMNQPLSLEQIQLARRLGAATIYEAQGQRGAMESAIKPLDPMFFVAGRALTVDAKPGDNLMLHYALSIAQPGDVLVVDAKGFIEAGPWGDVMTFAARQAGIAGLVIDGSVRDSSAIVADGFPVFSRGVCMKGTEKKLPGRVNTRIICAGVEVNPGDAVVGDRDGVVVIPADELEHSLALAVKREEKEAASRQALAEGKKSIDLLGLRPILQQCGLG